MRARAAGVAAAVLAGLTITPALTARPVNRPITKGLPHGAVFQPKPSSRTCFGSSGAVRLGRTRCSVIAQLRHVDTTQSAQFAADSRAVYLAAQGGVLLLKRDAAGALSYLDCFQISGPCTSFSEDGTSVQQMQMAADGKHLYVVLNRARDEGTELHALSIGPDDRLSADPSCLLLIYDSSPGVPIDNSRGCRMDVADYHRGGYALALAPDGTRAFMVELANAGSNLVIDSFAVDAQGSLTLLPGCASATGTRPPDTPCETLLGQKAGDEDLFNISDLAVTTDSRGLIMRGDDKNLQRGNFIARFAIEPDGSLRRTACLTRIAAHGCTGQILLQGTTTAILPLRDYLYVTSSGNPEGTERIVSDVVSFRLATDGGLNLAGCTGHDTEQFRARKIRGCTLAREPVRGAARLLASPDGKTLVEVGTITGYQRAIGIFKAGGVAKAMAGAGGCLLEAAWLNERALCNRVFTAGVLANSESTLALTADGRNAYVVDQQRDETAVYRLDLAR